MGGRFAEGLLLDLDVLDLGEAADLLVDEVEDGLALLLHIFDEAVLAFEVPVQHVVDGGEYRDIATSKRGETTFTDYKVKEGEKVSYYIQLVLGKGKKSTPSNVANVSIK